MESITASIPPPPKKKNIYTGTVSNNLVSVGLTQARPNYEYQRVRTDNITLILLLLLGVQCIYCI